jgi:chemotaxis protein histidine kinase CheA
MMRKPLSEAPAPASSPTTRDPKTLELLTEFVTQADVGLRRVDEVLMDSARSPIAPEALGEVLRVFRELKAASGRVDADDVLRLSQQTEALLEATRAGRVHAHREVLDALFEASLVMRELLEEVWSAAVESRTFVSTTALEATVSKLTLAQNSDADDTQ